MKSALYSHCCIAELAPVLQMAIILGGRLSLRRRVERQKGLSTEIQDLQNYEKLSVRIVCKALYISKISFLVRNSTTDLPRVRLTTSKTGRKGNYIFAITNATFLLSPLCRNQRRVHARRSKQGRMTGIRISVGKVHMNLDRTYLKIRLLQCKNID